MEFAEGISVSLSTIMYLRKGFWENLLSSMKKEFRKLSRRVSSQVSSTTYKSRLLVMINC